MANNEAFFEEPKPAAVLKHGILSRYLRPFVQKTGKTSKGGRVAYIDGYAGPGVYEDGSAGSPTVAVDIAGIVVDANGEGRIDGYFVERDHASAEALRALFIERDVSWPVYEGDVEQHLPAIVRRLPADEALFAFLDPFGLGIPLDMIESQLLTRAGPIKYGYRTDGAAAEVLLNFSFAGLRRTAGHLDTKGSDPRYLKARESIIVKLDRAMGGDWWQDIWRSEDPDREDMIRREYVKRITELPGGWRVFTVEVSNAINARPTYCLLLLTQHPDGAWLFNNAVSSASEEWRTACYDASGAMDFEPLPVREEQWVAEIKRSMTERLTQGSYVVKLSITGVYGASLGLAREKHVRKAMKQLHADGLISHDGKGDVANAQIKKPN